MKKVDSITQSIIERRDRLGWSDETLAEKSKVPLIIIQRFLEGSFCLSGYLSQIKSSFNEAIKSFYITEKKQNADGKKALKSFLALIKDKLKFERHNEDGTSSFVSLNKVNVNENFFSSWSSSMAYVLGVIYTDGNLNAGRIKEPWIVMLN